MGGVIEIISIHVPTTYEAYIQTDKFDIEIRQPVFKRDGYKCVVCGNTENLQPHHLTYRNIYHESLDDLITLCNRCHSIYHAIEKRREAIEEMYRNAHDQEIKEYEEQRQREAQKYEQERARREEINKSIEQEIKDEYYLKDYCKGGDLDMMSWEVINAVIDKKCKKYNIEYYSGNKKPIQDFFLYRRCEFLLRCMDQNFTYADVLAKTNFDSQWLSKWYRRNKCQAKLNEEKEIKEAE